MKKIKPVITLGILSMILTVGISVQLKTIKAADIRDLIFVNGATVLSILG